MNRPKAPTRNGPRQHGPPPPSFTGFFSKILPSNRPEQGGTARVHHRRDDGDCTHTDLRGNSNDLGERNIAQERPSRSRSQDTGPETPHRGVPGKSIRRHAGPELALSDNPQISSQLPSFSNIQPRIPRPDTPPNPVEAEAFLMSKEEIATILREKEESRERRRHLIASGDWLGVQGADPNSGEYAVLTPTTTPSSDTTSPSTKQRLEHIAQKKKEAELVYERIKFEEAMERQKALEKKGKSKLEKMGRAKEQVRQQQQGFPTWSKNRGRWSAAAAGPALGWIPQSVDSGNEASYDSKLIGVPANSAHAETSKEGQKDGNQRSTDTIVKKSTRGTDPSNQTIKRTGVVQPSHAQPMPPQQRERSERRFLWFPRRRMTDPGELDKHQRAAMIRSSAGNGRDKNGSNATETPLLSALHQDRGRQDHFNDLRIPDYHLHLTYPERTAQKNLPLTPASPAPPLAATTISSGSGSIEGPTKAILQSTTNLIGPGGTRIKQLQHVADASLATVISSQLTPKESTKSRDIHQHPVPTGSSSSQTGTEQEGVSQLSARESGQSQGRPDANPTPETASSGNIPPSASVAGAQELRPEPPVNGGTGTHPVQAAPKLLGVSVSIPTTITTGSGRSRLSQPLKVAEVQTKGENGTLDTEGALVIPSSLDGPVCTKSAMETEQPQIYSPPTTPQRDSQSSKLAQEIADPDTASMDYVTREAEAQMSAEVPPAVRGQNLNNALMDLVREKLECVGIAMLPPPESSDKEEGKRVETQNVEPLISDRLESHPETDKGESKARRAATYHSQNPRRAMVQEAARIAMQRSRAREVYTTGIRTPSPQIPEQAAAKTDGNLVDGDIGSPSGSRTGALNRQSFLVQGSGRRSCLSRRCKDYECGEEQTEHRKKRDANKRVKFVSPERETTKEAEQKPAEGPEPKYSGAAALLSVLYAALIVLFGLGWAWWIAVSPVFDTGSEIRKRRRRGANTWRDYCLFMMMTGAPVNKPLEPEDVVFVKAFLQGFYGGKVMRGSW
ncbi:hypothetical protein GGS20DRAFT_133433 [Poronia punctata]|nr:hypothetical protein GGS20DRAFT_133433 [Poronia punctata]